VSTSDDSGSAHLRTLAATPSPAAASGVRQQPIANVPGARGATHARAPDLGPPRPAPAEPKLTPAHSYGSRTVPAYSAEPSVSIEEAPDIEIFEVDEPAMSDRGIALIEEQERLLEAELDAEQDNDESTRAMPPTPDEIKATMRAQAPEPLAATADRPSPTATGDLTRTPLVHLLVYMLDTRLTGTTVFQTPDGISHGVFFTDGTPAKVQTGTVVDPLDRVILDLGLLDEATLSETLREVSRRRMLHGRHLVAKGLLDRETVLSVLRLQMVRKITHLFDLPAGTQYAYYEGVNLLAGYGGPELTPCEPLALIMAGVRLRGDDPLVDATLERISGRRLGLRREGDTRRFELQRHETAAVDLLRSRPMTLGQLLNAGLGHERAVKLTMYALAITRHLDLGVVAKLPVGVVPGEFRQPEATPSSRPPAAPRSPVPATPPPRGAPVAAMPTPLVTVVPTLGSSPTPTPAAAPTPPPPPARPQRELPPVSATGPGSAPVTAPARTVRTGFGIAFGQTPPRSPPPPVSPSPPPTASTPPAARSMRPAPAKAAEALRASVGAVPTPASPVPHSDFRPSDPPRSMPPMSRPPGSRPPVSRPADSMAPSGPVTGRHSYTGEHAARKQEIDQRAANLDAEDYFSLLGVPRTATADEIQDAYFALAKIWHPDRQPLELVGHKVKVARVFARMTEACQTLTDAAKRHDYQRAIDQGGGTPEDQRKIARVVDAALEFQKAEILLRKHDLVGAEVLAARAVQADPDQPEYLTLLVWIQAQRRGEPPPLSEGRTSTHYDDLIKVLDGVLGKEPRYERALFYRGMLLKRAGRADKAIRDFRLAAEINPRNLDAMREVRLYEMRRRSGGVPSEHPRSGPPGSGGGGLFGKLFKK
jgi:DnaJ-domain-containing protein 1